MTNADLSPETPPAVAPALTQWRPDTPAPAEAPTAAPEPAEPAEAPTVAPEPPEAAPEPPEAAPEPPEAEPPEAAEPPELTTAGPTAVSGEPDQITRISLDRAPVAPPAPAPHTIQVGVQATLDSPPDAPQPLALAEDPNDPITLRYIGAGKRVNLPMRDLTWSEVLVWVATRDRLASITQQQVYALAEGLDLDTLQAVLIDGEARER